MQISLGQFDPYRRTKAEAVGGTDKSSRPAIITEFFRVIAQVHQAINAIIHNPRRKSAAVQVRDLDIVFRLRLFQQILAFQPLSCFLGGIPSTFQAYRQFLQLLITDLVHRFSVQGPLDLLMRQIVGELAQWRSALAVAGQAHAQMGLGPGYDFRPGQQAVDHITHRQFTKVFHQRVHNGPVVVQIIERPGGEFRYKVRQELF